MQRVGVIALVLIVIGLVGGAAALAIVSGTHEVSACTTASATAPGVTVPGHSVDVDGVEVKSIPGVTTPGTSDVQTVCVTATATDSTVTTGQSTTTTTTTQPTTTSPPPPPPNNCTAALSPSTGDVVDTFFNNSANGNVLCLHGGDYAALPVWTDLTRSGTASTPLILQSYPGELATLHGLFFVEGNYVTLQHLKLDIANTNGGLHGGQCGTTRYGQAPIIAGTNVTLDSNEVFQSITSFGGYPVGAQIYIQAGPTTVSHNEIHDTGICNAYDHGVYVGHGSGTRVFQNWIHHTHAGWGIQIYPNAAGTRAYSNVIDSADAGFTICSNLADNDAYNNVVTNSIGGGNTGSGSLFSGSSGTAACGAGGVDVYNNDQFGNPGGFGNCNNPLPGVTCSGNISIDPQYANAAAHDYTVLNPSLAGYGLPALADVGP